MKIFIVSSSPLVEKSAQATQLQEKAKQLTELGNCVHIFTPSRYQQNHCVFNKNVTDLAYIAFGQFKFLIHIFYSSTIERPDIIVSRSALTFPSLVVSKLLGIPHVVEVHGILHEEISFNRSDSKIARIDILLQYIASALEYASYKLSDKIIAVTPGLKEYICSAFGKSRDDVAVVPNGVNTNIFRPFTNDGDKSELNEPTICFVGNLVRWQGIQYLIESASIIFNTIPEAIILIIGDGVLMDSLRYMVRSKNLDRKIIFASSIKYEEVPKYINKSDVCVAPFVRERNMKIGLSPLKIFEYAACGKPIVCSRINNLEFIENEQIGILVNPEDPEDLAKALIKLLSNKDLREQMGRNGRSFIKTNCSWDKIAKELHSIYSEQLN